MEDRFVDLESRIAFQEHTLYKLADTIAEHQREIYRLSRELEAVKAKLSAVTPSLIADPKDEPPPPHY